MACSPQVQGVSQDMYNDLVQESNELKQSIDDKPPTLVICLLFLVHEKPAIISVFFGLLVDTTYTTLSPNRKRLAQSLRVLSAPFSLLITQAYKSYPLPEIANNQMGQLFCTLCFWLLR